MVSCMALVQVLTTMAGSDPEVLQWHLSRQPSKALSLCIEALACAGALIPHILLL